VGRFKPDWRRCRCRTENESNCGNRERHPHHLRPLISLCLCCVEHKKGTIERVKYWEIIADNLSKAGWSWGVSQRWIQLSGQCNKGATVSAGLQGYSMT